MNLIIYELFYIIMYLQEIFCIQAFYVTSFNTVYQSQVYK